MYEELLAGAYDLHVHTGPDVLNRKLDDVEMAERLRARGMKGHGIKSHYFCTAERARIINRVYEGYHAIGAISLNNSVGGLNPLAVDMAARDGAKIVWMPTFDADNEQRHFSINKPQQLPHWARLRMEFAEKGVHLPTITVLSDGELKPEAREVLEAVKQHDLILATGHLGKEEIYAMVTEAARMGIRKIVITHPNFPSIRLTKEEQKELADLGAIMEFCYTTPHSGKATWESVFEDIRHVGPERCILSTDLGQPAGPYPDDGYLDFIKQLMDKGGFSREDIRRMAVINTTELVES